MGLGRVKRNRRRLREIDFEEVEKIKRVLDLRAYEVAELLGISESQYQCYRRCGKAPASRVYALRDALLVDVEQRARRERDHVMQLFILLD